MNQHPTDKQQRNREVRACINGRYAKAIKKFSQGAVVTGLNVTSGRVNQAVTELHRRGDMHVIRPSTILRVGSGRLNWHGHAAVNEPDASGAPPGVLKVKIGQIMFLGVNLDPIERLLKNVQVVVLVAVDEAANSITVCKLSDLAGDGTIEQTYNLPRVLSEFALNIGTGTVTCVHRQFPLLHSPCMLTVARGKHSLGNVCLDLRDEVWNHGA